MGVQNVAENLLLRENHAALGGCLVDGHDKDHDGARIELVRKDLLVGLQALCEGSELFLEGVNILARRRADVDGRFIECGAVGQGIRLVPGDHEGQLFGTEEIEQLPIQGGETDARVHDEDGNVGLGQHPAGALDALFAQLALVVEAGGVDDDHGAEGQELHCLFDRVGGGALDVGDHGELLTRDAIHDAGFPGVAHTVETDVDPLCRGGIVQAHGDLPFLFRRGDGSPQGAVPGRFSGRRPRRQRRAVRRWSLPAPGSG